MAKVQFEDQVKYMETLYPKVLSEIKEYAIFAMDVYGNVLTWNKGCINLKEYQSDEIIGKNYELLFPDFLRDKNIPREELEIAAREGKYESENWRRKKSGELFWAHVVLTKIENEEGEFVGFIKITQDLSERKHFEDHLRRKNTELREANEDMDNFIYTASHDLKAPINNLEGLITSLFEELKEDCTFREEVIHLKELIGTSIEKFRTTINDLAITARIEGSSKTGMEEVHFKDLLDEIRLFLIDDINKTKADLQGDFSQTPTIHFSRKNIRSILINLISNAIKFRSPERAPEIRIKTKNLNDYLLLEVSDDGLGIKEEDKNKVFSLYERLHDHVDGSGVGMAIVARIVENNGGYIEIDSKVNKGSTFRIFLKA